MRLGWAGKVGVGAAIPVVAGTLVFLLVTLDRVRDVTRADVEESLRNEAVVCAHALRHGGVERQRLATWATTLDEEIGARVTVIDGDGKVLADSRVEEVATMENHNQRPEVVAAREKGSAVRTRYSHTLRRELVYAAARLPQSDLVVRIARDLSGVEEALQRPTRGFLVVALAIVALGCAGALLFARGVARPLRELTTAAERVEGGDLDVRVFPHGGDEVARLGHAFNRMTKELRETLGRSDAEAARLAAILEGMTEGVLAIDHSERISFLNGAARTILGLPAGTSLQGSALYELVREPRILALVQTAAGGTPAEGEIRHEGPPRRLIQVHALPAGRSGVIVVVRDMSRLRRLEQMRSDFVSNVSHELRTPLASIAAAVETLRDPETRTDSEEGPRFLEMIRRNMERLEALLNDILALSRLESRPETLPRSPFDFGAVVRTAGEELESRAAKAGVALRLQVERCRVLGDPSTLRRVADNLLVNAITYTPAGGRIEVTVGPRDGNAVLEVKDTGIGIPAEDLDRIFERFYRVDKARSRSAGGTGLGLAIVKHAVGLHGGTIEVQSALTKGSTFTVRLPLEPEPANAERSDGGQTGGETA